MISTVQYSNWLGGTQDATSAPYARVHGRYYCTPVIQGGFRGRTGKGAKAAPVFIGMLRRRLATTRMQGRTRCKAAVVCTDMLVNKNTLCMLCGQPGCKPAQRHRCYHAASVMRCTPCAIRHPHPVLTISRHGTSPPQKKGGAPSRCVCVWGGAPLKRYSPPAVAPAVGAALPPTPAGHSAPVSC